MRVGVEGCAFNTLPLLLRESEFFHGGDRISSFFERVLSESLTLEHRRIHSGERDVVVGAVG